METSAMVDSGCDAILADTTWVTNHQGALTESKRTLCSPLEAKKRWKPDGETLLVTQMTDCANVTKTRSHNMIVTHLYHTQYTIILGMEWLELIDPDIRWAEREWFFREELREVTGLRPIQEGDSD